jgi:hypothetical protein
MAYVLIQRLEQGSVPQWIVKLYARAPRSSKASTNRSRSKKDQQSLIHRPLDITYAEYEEFLPIFRLLGPQTPNDTHVQAILLSLMAAPPQHLHSPVSKQYQSIYEEADPASAIEAAFASATLLFSPCFPFYPEVSKPFPRSWSSIQGMHSRSTLRISTPSLLCALLPIAYHLSSCVGQLVRRPRGTCCSC